MKRRSQVLHVKKNPAPACTEGGVKVVNMGEETYAWLRTDRVE